MVPIPFRGHMVVDITPDGTKQYGRAFLAYIPLIRNPVHDRVQTTICTICKASTHEGGYLKLVSLAFQVDIRAIPSI